MGSVALTDHKLSTPTIEQTQSIIELLVFQKLVYMS